jgi:hypothetical protein
VAHFAALAPRHALAAIRAARLSEATWLELVPRLPIQARGFLRHRRDLGPAVEALLSQLGIDDFALAAPDLPPAEPAAMAQPEPEPDSAPASAEVIAFEQPAPLLSPAASEGIGAIVRRIEAFRRDRETRPAGQAPAGGQPPRPPIRIRACRLPTNRRPPRSIPKASTGDRRARHGGRCRCRLGTDAGGPPPVHRAAPCTGPAGWAQHSRLCRAPSDHRRPAAARRRAGHRRCLADRCRAGLRPRRWRLCRLSRPAAPPHPGEASAPAQSEAPATQGADRLRQTLHELRTPINAIQGFAEMIQQQVFGATPHQYRSLAASIAADAARMLAGFEDLERLARLETGAADMPAPQADTDLAALLARQIAQLDPVIGPREVRLRWTAPAAPLPVRAPAAELEHAVWRLLAVIASTAAPGERLAIALDTDGDQARLDLPLPATLAMRDDATLFAADSARGQGSSSLGAGGMMGNGFALRLAAAELRAMGGSLHRDGARLLVRLPAALAPDQTDGAHGATPAQAG